MTCGGVSIAVNKVSESFAQFFQEKVSKIISNAVIDPNVYNGRTKMAMVDGDFMTAVDILECINQLKMKNCEGYDRIPQIILIGGINVLITPLTK